MFLGQQEINEIKASYRDAKNKRKQIIILSQLYAVGLRDIMEITGAPEACETMDADCRYCYDNGMNDKQISEYIGCPLSVVTKWRTDNLLP